MGVFDATPDIETHMCKGCPYTQVYDSSTTKMNVVEMCKEADTADTDKDIAIVWGEE